MSIKYKIALLFAAAVTLILSVVNLSIYFFSLKESEDSFRSRLRNRVVSTAEVFKSIRGSGFSMLRRIDESALASLHHKSVIVQNSNDSVVYRFSDMLHDSISLSNEVLKKAREKKEYYFSYNEKEALVLHYTDSKSDFFVGIAAANLEGIAYLRQLKRILWIALFVSIAISYLIGVLFARKLLNPFKRLIGEVDLITSNNLSQRINTSEARDEISKLSQTINNLLDRLNDSFAIQRRFISNASHELSTPLTSVSSQLEVAMQKNRTPEEYREVMQSVYEDIMEMQHLTRSLLDIAKTGSQGSIDLTQVRIDEVLIKVASDVQKQNKLYRTELNFEELPDDDQLLTVFGNANLLYIALKNIIENGCKYSDNKQSSVGILFNKTYITIHVTNKGDVITEADIQNIFQPFFRAETAQSKPGFGLGLTLTKRILSLHNGSISVESSLEKGTIFTIRLPNI